MVRCLANSVNSLLGSLQLIHNHGLVLRKRRKRLQLLLLRYACAFGHVTRHDGTEKEFLKRSLSPPLVSRLAFRETKRCVENNNLIRSEGLTWSGNWRRHLINQMTFEETDHYKRPITAKPSKTVSDRTKLKTETIQNILLCSTWSCVRVSYVNAIASDVS